VNGGGGADKPFRAMSPTQTQYISLQLIIITLIIASYLSPATGSSPVDAAAAPSAPAAPRDRVVGEMPLPVREDGSRAIDEGLLAAIASVLANHDIRAEIDLVVGNGEESVAEAIGRGIEIVSRLDEDGSAPESAVVTILPEGLAGAASDNIRFLTDEVR
jgi:hypothetical protein